jgi:putative SOS response-associated peptidase YedK
MCGRYTLTKKPAMIEKTLGREFGPLFRPRYNIAPTQLAPAFLNENGGVWRELRWGLIPSWAKDESIGSKLINARSEGIESKPSFRNAFKKHRCLIPADGFFEWRGSGRTKEPLWIFLRDQAPFAFAALAEHWEIPTVAHDTFSIITTSSNELIAPFHTRMPVILPQNSWHQWLDSTAPTEKLLALLKSYPAEEMQFHPVDQLVNNVHSDNENCIKPFEPAQRMLF